MRIAASVVVCAVVAMAAGCQSHGSRIRTVEPHTQQFLNEVNSSGGPPIYTLTPEAARQVLVDLQSAPIPIEAPSASIEDRVLECGPTGTVRVRIVKPEGESEALPAVMYFHGGGWVLGDAPTHDRLIREIATGARVAVVFVDYDRSPEARFPTALEQGYAATEWVAAHGAEIGVDGTRIAVAGDSAGGNIATAVTMVAKERTGPKIRYQVLFYPVTDANFDTGSYRQFAEGYFLTRKAMQWFWDCYVPDVEQRKDPHASPLRATMDRLAVLPPALIITAEHDVLRDEGEAYAHKLAQAGVRVDTFRALGTMHDFVMLNAITATPAPRNAIGTANAVLSSVLRK